MTTIARTFFVTLVMAMIGVVAAQPDIYELPGDQVFPEGVVVSDDGSTFYVGSTSDGTIFEGDVQSGEVSVFAEDVIPTAIGMELDPEGRLWVAGGSTGQVYVFDTETGDLLETYDTPEAESTFLNDLVYANDAVFVTDSARPELFRIGAGTMRSELTSFVSFEDSPFPYDQQFNANGIVVSPDGSALVIVHSGHGQLFRVDLETLQVTEVESSAEPVTAGDGLTRDGNTLYVVRNQVGQVDQLTLSDAGDAVEPAGDPITSDLFQFPTTADVANGSLLVVNSQFDEQGGEPELPFNVARVDLP